MRASVLGTTSGRSRPRCELARRLLLAGCAALGACLATVTPSKAQSPRSLPVAETNANSQLSPPQRDDVAEQEQASWSLRKLPPQTYMNEIYWPRSPETIPFLSESLLQLVGRTYNLTRDNFDGSRTQGFTVGGWIAWRSGLIGNIFGVHAALYTSQKLYAPDGEGGSRLLTAEQDPINVVGQIYARAQFGDQEIRGGRMLVDTPLINPQDNRMVPNTFEGAQIVSLPDKDRMYDYAAGYLWTIKQRDSNDFIPMSDALAGADTINRGTPFGMFRVRPMPGLTAVVMDYYVEDFINSAFGQVEYNFQQPKGVPNWILGGNIIHQSSVGNSLLTGLPFTTYQASGKVQVSYLGWTLFAAGSVTGEGSKIFSPFGSKPNYTDMQQVSFDNPREKAFGVSAAYDFGGLGLNGFSGGVWYTVGWDAFDAVKNAAIHNRNEFDVWLQYRPSEGPLKGLRIKTQYSNVWQNGNVRDTQPEFRFIVDYTVLFRPLFNVVSVAY